jgi:GeoRSP system SPASM domain protein
MIELASPIRLYWDLAPGQPAGEDVERLCADIIAARFLSIHLRDHGEQLSPAVLQALSFLTDPARAVLLSAQLSAIEAREVLPSGIRQLIVMVASRSDISRVAQLKHRFARQELGISLQVPGIDLADVPALIAAAVAEGIKQIHFPMQRLTSGESCWVPSTDSLATLTAAMQQHPLADTPHLTIHDPFLWRAFHPALPFPDGGCQAANTMLYIAAGGEVYPCPLVPVSLGNVQETDLTAIARGEAKQRMRALIRQIPHLCGTCAELSTCHAGCRGRAFVLEGWTSHDPACGR